MTQDNLSAVLHGIDDMRLEQREMPKAGAGQLLIRMHTVGICGSDVHFWKSGCIGSFVVKEPMVLGHESAGVVAGIGEGVKGFEVGDKIAIEPGLSCKGCEPCKGGRYNLCPESRFFATPPVHGALSRFIVHDADFCFKLPKHVTFEEGALLEPLSVAVHTCRRANLSMGQSVLVTGAGPIGTLCMMAAKAQGASQVVIADLDEGRLSLAKKLGADQQINTKGKSAEEIAEEVLSVLGKRPDATLECTGAATCVSTGILATKPGGVLVQVGMGPPKVEIPIIEAAIKEVDIRSTFRYANCYPTALELVASKKVDLSGLTRAYYPLEQSLEAFQRNLKGDVMKVFITC